MRLVKRERPGCDFRVTRSVVLRALQWLLANNIYYRNIRIYPDALALLPEDGDLTGLHSVTVETDDQEMPPAQNDANDAHNDSEPLLNLSFQSIILKLEESRVSAEMYYSIPWSALLHVRTSLHFHPACTVAGANIHPNYTPTAITDHLPYS